MYNSNASRMDFNQLINTLKLTHNQLYQNTVKAINVNLTLRNWFFGFYIVEFEQKGEDRAKYGKKMLQNLAKSLSIKGLSAPELSRCRQFYGVYPEILGLLTQKSMDSNLKIYLSGFDNKSILGLPTQEFEDVDLRHLLATIQSISYTHFVELIKIEDKIKRRFYELLILKTHPSVTELKRQINSLTFERLGLSMNKELSIDKLLNKITPVENKDLVKSHYVFDFLELIHNGFIEESDIEQALLDYLQYFILELGDGFCFEARQKRILVDDEYYFIDLVFYHRILKCHVLIELKTEQAKHEHIGQLKFYLEHYKRNMLEVGDNPPVGILLVTDKKKTMVEYAIADSDKEIFVSKYSLQLPDKAELEKFINDEIHKI
jgi:predicted nuclease of restriction endonuclease-like (RecB) superfamily